MAIIGYIWILVVLVAGQAWADFKVSNQDLKVHINDAEIFVLYLTENLSKNVIVLIEAQHPDLVSPDPKIITANGIDKWNISVKGLHAGHSIVSVNVTPPDVTEDTREFDQK